jgi:nucleotide-binding universal stress UspA family protein
MYKRILVAFDESEVAGRALTEAITMAKDSDAVLRIVHAVDVMFPATTDMVYVDLEAYRRDRIVTGQGVVDGAAARARAAGVQVETGVLEVEGSRYSNAILTDAKSWGAQLIVVGTRGRGALIHLLLGSVAERIIRHSPVPVLLVGSPEKHK